MAERTKPYVSLQINIGKSTHKVITVLNSVTYGVVCVFLQRRNSCPTLLLGDKIYMNTSIYKLEKDQYHAEVKKKFRRRDLFL